MQEVKSTLKSVIGYKETFIGATVLGLIFFAGLHNFLFIHTIAELFGIIIAAGIFVFVWNSRRFLDNNYLLLLGSAYLFVGLLDLLHTFTYKGIEIIHASGSNLPTQLWIAARYLESSAFLIAPFLIKKRVRLRYLVAALVLVTASILLSIFYWETFPVCYAEGFGLTPFKKASEFIIAAILLVSIALLWRRRANFDKRVVGLLIASIGTTVLSELFFTHYVNVYGFANLSGHILKIISYYLVYKAIIEQGLSRPYAILLRDLKENEDKLRSSQARYRAIIEDQTELICRWKPDGTLTFVNEAYLHYFQKDRKELVGQNFMQLIPEEDRRQLQDSFAALSRENPVLTYEHRVALFEGQVRWQRWSSRALFDQDNNIREFQGVGRDITAEKKASEKIRHLATFPELNPNPVLEINSAGKITFANLAAIKELGRLKSAKQIDLFFPEDFPQMLKMLNAGEGGSFSREVKIGASTFVEGIVIYPALGVIRVYARDITEQKAAQQALEKAHGQLEIKVEQRTAELKEANINLSREIAERITAEKELSAKATLLKLQAQASSRKDYVDSLIKLIKGWSDFECVGIRIANKDNKIPYESYVGFDKEFWAQENLLSLDSDKCACIRVIKGVPEGHDRQCMTDFGSFRCENSVHFMKCLSREEQAQFRGTCIKHGYVSLAIVPIRYKEQIIGAIHCADKREGIATLKMISFIEKLTAVIGTAINKFSLEDRIQQEHATLDAFFNHSITPLVFLDPDFNFIRVNEAYARTFNKKVGDFLGRNHFALYPHEENEAIFRKVVNTKTPYQVFSRPFVFPDYPQKGVSYWDWQLVPILNDNKDVEFLVFSLVDVTERKQAEEKLMVAEKELLNARRLADIGTLAATVAHELRNPLAAMRMAAYNIKRKAQNPKLDRHLENIETKIKDSEQIINNLLFYSRLKKPELTDAAIYDIIEKSIADSMANYPKRGIKIKKNFNELQGRTISADKLQLNEMFSNILNNAFEATPEKGAKIEIGGHNYGPGSVKITVKDNGQGIAAEDLERVFEPFFSTKAKGTGLGLTVCHQIAQLHGGSLNIESKKEEGTSVEVILPVERGKSE